MKRCIILAVILLICIYLNASDMYIVGTMNDWTATDAYKMTEVTENAEWTYDFGDMELVGQRIK